MTKSIQQLLGKYGLKPKNLTWYLQALTHPSYSNEKKSEKSYQRLEFLGDAILSKLSAEKIFLRYPNMDEGEMTIIRSNSVNGKHLAQFTVELGLDNLIRFGNNNETLRKNEKILEDIFESFVGAIYLDLGEDAVKEFLVDTVFKFIKSSNEKEAKNPKTVLQEFLQAESRENIVYICKEARGGFKAKVLHDETTFGKGWGRTKKDAEISAAKNALEKLGEKQTGLKISQGKDGKVKIKLGKGKWKWS